MQNDSPFGEFLQSEVWRQFQESVGRKTFHLSSENFWANIIFHKLPVVGKYFYVPRGPEVKSEPGSGAPEPGSDFGELIKLAKENNAGWIRIDPETEELLEAIRKNINYKIAKAPHDMQPKELYVIDIAKSEEELLAEMKAKTRYNIKLSQKHNVLVKVISNFQFPISNKFSNPNDQIKEKKYIEEFLRLTGVMARRQGIVAHPENYYRQMLEIIPGDNLKLYVAQYEGKIIAANLVVFYGETCIYLHGASDDNFRNVMAPYLLQWRQICDAKKAGCMRYDFGGIKTVNSEPAYAKASAGEQETVNGKNTWSGITKFKLGFAPKTLPTVFPGSYDIIINPVKYWLYRFIQKVKSFC
ncbi:MAG: peptidoglycan bridge formation glycyltransferase FemA/FemB family protein [Parcubacteria group bacterium]